MLHAHQYCLYCCCCFYFIFFWAFLACGVPHISLEALVCGFNMNDTPAVIHSTPCSSYSSYCGLSPSVPFLHPRFRPAVIADWARDWRRARRLARELRPLRGGPGPRRRRAGLPRRAGLNCPWVAVQGRRMEPWEEPRRFQKNGRLRLCEHYPCAVHGIHVQQPIGSQ